GREGTLNWCDGQPTTGFLQGINSRLQAGKSRARGYRPNRNFIAMAYLI
ncbi:MAG TPA: ISL3 family transposase, partial [Clostridiales bacterium UBA8153]|nr:ISL3 family transposase [Clostridiales bacterium UBA8153]